MSYRTRTSPPQAPKVIASVLWVAWTAFGAGPALADKDDRTKPINITFERRGVVDIARGRTEVVGDVVLTQGSMLLRAERADVRETPGGFHQAFASGASSKQVSFHQGRDARGESVEGSADQLDYDTRADTVRLLGNARMRQVQGALVIKEVTGAAVAYDERADILAIEGGSSSPNPKGRGRILLMPPANRTAEGDAFVVSPLMLQPTLTLGQRY